MTDQLFKKVVSITDIHFGRNGNSPQANQDNIDFLEWMIDEAKTWGAEACVMMGDWHDNRHSLHVSTMHYSLMAIRMLNKAFNKVYWIPGNHDLFYRDRRDVSSVEFAQHLTNIEVIRDPTTIGGVTFLPWLIGDEYKKLKAIKSRYMFGHLELPGFMMNAKVEMPAHSESGVTHEHFVNQDYVFTGHFHFRQQRGKVLYTGNIMPFNFADTWDEDRGAMFLEWGKEPEFRAWPDQPLFRTMRLSEMLESPKTLLLPKLTARVGIDMDISYEEAQVIKETFIAEYQLRKVELTHQHVPAETETTMSEDIVFQSIDQIITEGLLSVESETIKPDRLIDIYKSLNL